MKTDLDHLPEKQQRELQHVTDLLLNEFERAVAGGTQPWRQKAKVLKIVLFGSYARNDWVDEPENGYQSDFDLLIVVNNDHLTDIADYWYVAEDKILRDISVNRTVNIIVHSLSDVNRALSNGEYFWIDIIREGISLHELPGHSFSTPEPSTPADAIKLASDYFEKWSPGIERRLTAFEMEIGQAVIQKDPEWLKDGAFTLHQAVERAYACFLLVRTLYFPRSHNIKFLRSLAEDKDKRLIEAWPRDSKIDRRRFELLKRAYVDARYSDQFEISAEDLQALMVSARRLRDIVREVSLERLAILRAEAAEGA
ncbi:MAG: HEPN domain-containing protein [Caulobacteraceae bacterium]